MAPQIRLIQNNDSELVEKIQSSLINTIPLWKNQIVIALGITNAKNALGAQKQVTQMTNDMLTKNSELLKQGTIEIAEESEKAVVDVQTLQKPNQDIIDTLDKVIEIHENGRVKRQEAEVQLEEIENKLKEKLLEDLKVTGKTLIVVKELTDNLILASRNLSNVKVIESHEINTYDVLNYNNVVITEEAVKMLEEVLR